MLALRKLYGPWDAHSYLGESLLRVCGNTTTETSDLTMTSKLLVAQLERQGSCILT